MGHGGCQKGFLPGVPTPDLTEMRLIEAKYPDGLAMGRATLKRLPSDKASVPLVSALASKFWSEHSARATLTSLSPLCPEFPPPGLARLAWQMGHAEVCSVHTDTAVQSRKNPSGHRQEYKTLISRCG